MSAIFYYATCIIYVGVAGKDEAHAKQKFNIIKCKMHHLISNYKRKQKT